MSKLRPVTLASLYEDRLYPDDLAHRLGGLAPWWMSDRGAPPRDASRGGALVMFEAQALHEASGGHIAPGVLLPLRWARDAEDDPALPPALHDIARRVRALASLPQSERWGLCLDISTRKPDLSALEMTLESAFVTLWAALRIVREGGELSADVLLTGEYDVQGACVRRVAGVAEKAHAALRWASLQQRDVSWFVPTHNEDEARAAIARAGRGARVEVQPIETGKPFADALAPALNLLDLEPALAAPLDARCAWANRPHRTPAQRERFYQTSLASDIAALHRPTLLVSVTEPAALLVMVLSKSPSLLFFAHHLCRPARTLLIHDQELAPHVTKVCDDVRASCLAQGFNTQLEPHLLHGASTDYLSAPSRDALFAHVRALSDGAPARVIFDLTAGTKSMGYLLLLTAQRLGARAFVTHTQFDKHPLYGTEQIEPFQP